MTPRESLAEVCAELQALAENATPGPYRVLHETPEFMAPYDAVVAADNNRSRCCIYTHDADYIAACTPERIQRLCAAWTTLRATLETYAIHVDEMSWHGEALICKLCGGRGTREGAKRGVGDVPVAHADTCMLFTAALAGEPARVTTNPEA